MSNLLSCGTALLVCDLRHSPSPGSSDSEFSQGVWIWDFLFYVLALSPRNFTRFYYILIPIYVDMILLRNTRSRSSRKIVVVAGGWSVSDFDANNLLTTSCTISNAQQKYKPPILKHSCIPTLGSLWGMPVLGRDGWKNFVSFVTLCHCATICHWFVLLSESLPNGNAKHDNYEVYVQLCDS